MAVTQQKTYYTIYQGNNKTIPVVVYDENTGEVVANTVLVSLQAADYGIFKISDDTDEDPNAPEQVVSKALLTGVSNDAANSTVTVFLLPEDTASLTPGKYLHELKIVLADHSVHTILQDEMMILPAYLT